MTRARPVPDLRLLPPVLAGWAAVRVALTHPPAAMLAASCALAVLGAVLLSRPGRLVPVGATLLVAGALAGSAALHVYAVRRGPVAVLADAQGRATVRATVTGDPKPVKGLILLPIRVDALTAGDGGATVGVRAQATVLAHPRVPADAAVWSALLPSMHIETAGRLEPPKDQAAGDAATLFADQAPKILGGPDLLQRFAGALRTDLRDAVAGLPAEPAGVLPALTLGDTRAVPAQTTADLKTAGLSFLVVVSGENLVFLSAAVLPLARQAGVRARALALVAALLALGFTALARPGPPMVRATVTALLASVAMATGRRFRGLTATAGAALILLLLDPWLAHAYGFVLSVAATAGLLISAPAWRDRLILGRLRVPVWIATPAAFTAAAEVYCEPLLVTFTGALPLFAVPANVLAVPAAPPATVLGVAAMAGYAVWPPAGHVVAWLAQWPARWICLVAHVAAGLPGAALPWPNGTTGMLTMLCAYGIGRKICRRLQQNDPLERSR
ncbi:MAG TPA: ComEC/Rec2 family competence protein [Actinospica sp.]|jgi:competence protein ComEC|nr:ComEC/Rec2 family competence protein [Actinospica sp.]